MGGKNIYLLLFLWWISSTTTLNAEDLILKNGKVYRDFEVTHITYRGLFFRHSSGGGVFSIDELPEQFIEKYKPVIEEKIIEHEKKEAKRKENETVRKRLKKAEKSFSYGFKIIQVISQGKLALPYNYRPIRRRHRSSPQAQTIGSSGFVNTLINQTSGGGSSSPSGYRYLENEPVLLVKLVSSKKSRKNSGSEGPEICPDGPFYTVGIYSYTDIRGIKRTVDKITNDKRFAEDYFRIQIQNSKKRRTKK